MKKRNKRWAALFLSGILAAFSAVSAFAVDSGDLEETLQSRYVKDIVDVVSQEYRFDVSKEELYRNVIDYVMKEDPALLEGAIRAVTDHLDPFSGYFSRAELSDFDQYVEPNYVGIGIEIERVVGALRIVNVMLKSPAEAAGLKADDRIIAINGEDATGFTVSMAAERVRGEAGTTVTLTILRGEETLSFTVERAKVSNNSTYFEEMDGVGYLQIAQFNSTTPREVTDALSRCDTVGIKKMIIDVRNNPGGELASVLRVLYKFVPKGLLLTKVDYNGEDHDMTYYSAAEFTSCDRKILILVNENTASAAELFSGAMQQHGLATLLGRRTFGKGVVQDFLGLNSLGGLELGDIKLTVAQYTLPNGECIHKIGVTPDREVKNYFEPLLPEDTEPLTFEAKYHKGDKGKAILAIKQRLSALGFQVGEINEEFDDELELAVYSYQEASDLYPYGVMDITTQTYLQNDTQDAEKEVDVQLETALNLMKEEAAKR